MELTAQGTPCAQSGYVVDIRRLDQWMFQATVDCGSTIDWPAVFSGHGTNQATRFAERLFRTLCTVTDEDSLVIDGLVIRFSAYFAITVAHNSPSRTNRPDPHRLVTDQRLTDSAVAPNNFQFSAPTNAVTMTTSNDASTNQASNIPGAAQPVVTLTHQYEFSAAHRLHCPQWSDKKNQDTFGKCNYPSGHGHNYRLEVSIQNAGLSAANEPTKSQPNVPEHQPTTDAPLASADWLNELVHLHVLDKIDHRFLNHDVPEFKTLNPSVENIASVVFKWLAPHFPANIRLTNVRVYETAKTWADVSGS